jgi:exopolysaccharide/PEP-CTERM locus tyrosine autokinase
MSKIYKALEKAEKERELGKTLPPIWRPEEMTEEKAETFPELKIVQGNGFDHRLVSLFQPASHAAEQFRKIRTLLLRRKMSDSLRTIMITSSTNSEGKSFVAANLAVGIARDLQTNALLVECDLRNPTLSQWFGLENGKGLAEYLLGEGKLSDYLKKTGVEKLSILTAGGLQDNPSELLGSNKMEAMIHELKSRDRDALVILDATPLLATTEPQILSKLVDGIIFVVRAGITPRETVQQAIGALGKEKVIGVVLNDLVFKSSGLYSRYFGSNGYYYGYGYGRKNPKPEGRVKKSLRFLNRLAGK